MVTDSLPEEMVPSILYCRVLYYSFVLYCTVLDSCVMTHMLFCYLLLTVPTILDCTVMYRTLLCCTSVLLPGYGGDWGDVVFITDSLLEETVPAVLCCTAVLLPGYGGDRGYVPCYTVLYCTVLYCSAVLLPGYGGDWGDVVFITDSVLEETVPAVLYCTVLLFFYLDMEETEGTLYLSQILS